MLEAKIFLDEHDLYQEKPLDEYIIRYLMHHHIKGATVFRGSMGYGSHHHLHTSRKLGASDALPIMILCVDEAEKIRSVLPHIKDILSEGVITIQHVEQF